MNLNALIGLKNQWTKSNIKKTHDYRWWSGFKTKYPEGLTLEKNLRVLLQVATLSVRSDWIFWQNSSIIQTITLHFEFSTVERRASRMSSNVSFPICTRVDSLVRYRQHSLLHCRLKWMQFLYHCSPPWPQFNKELASSASTQRNL